MAYADGDEVLLFCEVCSTYLGTVDALDPDPSPAPLCPECEDGRGPSGEMWPVAIVRRTADQGDA